MTEAEKQLKAKIEETKQQLETAKGMRYRDLEKYYNRLRKELRIAKKYKYF